MQIKKRRSIRDRSSTQREMTYAEDSVSDIMTSTEPKVDENITQSETQGSSRSESFTLPKKKRRNPLTENNIKNSKPCKYDFYYSLKWNVLMAIIVAVAITGGIIDLYGRYFKVQPKRICSFDNLKKQYPKQSDRLWKDLKYGVQNVSEQHSTKGAVYLFAHHGGQNVGQLIKDIAEYTSSCVDNNLVLIQRNDFMLAPGAIDDYGYTIQKYKNEVKAGNVILIANLNEIPAKAARSLHAICDTHSPIFEKVVIFLALTVHENIEGNANAKAEETLIELWGSELPRNELDALITRVTDHVIILES